MKWSNEKVLVTGGAGFLGGSIAEELIRRGAEVHIIDNMTMGYEESVPEGTEEVLKGNVNLDNLREMDNDYSYVFHFAAPCTILLFDKDPVSLYSNAIQGAIDIRRWVTENELNNITYASSATYYGKHAHKFFQPKAGPATLSPPRWKYQEDMPPTPANIYGATKTAEEDLDTVYPGPRYLGLRIFPCYGSRERLKGDISSVPYKIAGAVMHNKEMEIWGDGNQRRDYIYIDDFVDVTVNLVERRARGRINIGTGIESDINLLIYHAVTILDKPEWKPKYVENPYKDSYLHSLLSDPSLLLEWIGKYEFTSTYDGMESMISEMKEFEN